MKDPRWFRSYIFKASFLLAGLMVGVLTLPMNIAAQGGSSGSENIPAGSLIIAMDNERQGNEGNCNGPAFNLRAYGLAVRLLHQNVQLKWVIADSKATNAVYDIVGVNVAQLNTATYGGQTCEYTGGSSVSFRGGPLVIPPAFADHAKTVIASFNGETTNAQDDVRVYEAIDGFVAPVRYTLTHKPFVAVGPDCAQGSDCFSQDVYQKLYTAAGLVQGAQYAAVADNTFSQFCVTLAAQAHAQSTAINFISAYRNHVLAGGNLLLQCASVEIFEDNANGLFFTTDGPGSGINGLDDVGITSLSGEPLPATFNAQMPFNQFVGSLGKATGWSEFTVASGAAIRPQTVVAARRTSSTSSNYVAMVNDLTAGVGGNVFALGGHEYGGYSGDGIGSSGGPEVTNGTFDRVNGSRMALNTLLVPSNTACSFTPPELSGYKTVRLGTAVGDDGAEPGVINYGDIVEWTVRYINTGTTPIANFQITDPLDPRLTFQVGSLSASIGASPVATNSNYRGNTNNGYPNPADINLLGPGVTLGAGEMITVRFKTMAVGFGDIPNQGAALGNGIGTPVLTDSADSTTPGNTGGFPIAGDCANNPICVDQSPWVFGEPDDWTAVIEPTYIDLGTIPSSAPADVAGVVADLNGRGLAREQVVLQNASTGELRFATTNTFGRFVFREVPTGDFYIVSVMSKRYTFDPSSFSFDLSDNLTDIAFQVARPVSPGKIVPSSETGSGKTTAGQPEDASTPAARTVVSTPAAPAPKAPAVKAPTRTVIVRKADEKAKKTDDETEDENGDL